MPFIQDLLDATKDVESPRSYFYWAGLTAVSAVLGKRVWLDRAKKYKLYPNIYTFILSKKSGLRKGLPISAAKKLVHLASCTRIIDGQNSMQGILKDLGQVHTTDLAKKIINTAQGFLISGEFANFLIQDREAKPLTDLTDMYDTHAWEEGFKKRLASQDMLELKGLCLTALFGSNEVHFRNAIPDNAIRGGFLARCFCVYEEKRNKVNSLMADTEDDEVVMEEIPFATLVKHLKALEDLQGPIRVSNDARKLYNAWYYDFADKEIEDDTGTMERIGDTVLKAAMNISLAENTEMLIRVDHMDEAIRKTTECLTNVRKLIIGAQSTTKDTFRIVMSNLLSATENECSKDYLLIKGWGTFTVYDLDEVIEQLMQSHALVSEKRGGKLYYKLKEWVIKKHLELEGK